MFVRVTRTVSDPGTLVSPDKVWDLVDDNNVDWYVSAYTYGQEALEYFEKNKSIKGFQGEAWTDHLHWDFDSKEDFDLARTGVLNLLKKLDELQMADGVEVFFSGNKGFHVLLHTEQKFSPKDTKRICHNIAIDAGVDTKVFDTTVYNTTRIFRLEYTKHPSSKLFKIPVSYDELLDLSEKEIRKLAKSSEERNIWQPKVVDAESLKKLYPEKIKQRNKSNLIALPGGLESSESFDPRNCPPDKRRCIYVLENGYFGPGERENAIIRLAAYYKGQNWDKERVFEKITNALQLREQAFPDVSPFQDSDTWRNIDQVFSDGWQGGTYTCKTDDFLASKCDLGSGPCFEEKKEKGAHNVMTIGALVEAYKQYGEEALESYPKTGIEWLDQNIRVRPKNFSLWNGANSSGKTSLILQFMENLNNQKIYHLFFSADMADTSLFEKLAVKYTGYTYWQVEKFFNAHTAEPEKQQEIIKAIQEKLPYTLFDFTSSLSMKYIKKTVLALKEKSETPVNVQIVFVDYAGRIIGDKDSEYANSTKAATEANDVAKRTKTHIAFISQTPRERGDHTDPLRSSRVAKSSGAWEENATFVLNCWRPLGMDEANDLALHLYLAKSRNSAVQERAFYWDGIRGEISEFSPEEFVEYVQACEDAEVDLPKNQMSLEELTVFKKDEKQKKKGRRKFSSGLGERIKKEDEDNFDSRKLPTITKRNISLKGTRR